MYCSTIKGRTNSFDDLYYLDSQLYQSLVQLKVSNHSDDDNIDDDDNVNDDDDDNVNIDDDNVNDDDGSNYCLPALLIIT